MSLSQNGFLKILGGLFVQSLNKTSIVVLKKKKLIFFQYDFTEQNLYRFAKVIGK